VGAAWAAGLTSRSSGGSRRLEPRRNTTGNNDMPKIRLMHAVALVALAVFVAWATIDSTPKIVRLFAAHQRCGSWSGTCPAAYMSGYEGGRGRAEQESDYCKRELKRIMDEQGTDAATRSFWWGRC
jgi:hypothetical protein